MERWYNGWSAKAWPHHNPCCVMIIRLGPSGEELATDQLAFFLVVKCHTFAFISNKV